MKKQIFIYIIFSIFIGLNIYADKIPTSEVQKLIQKAKSSVTAISPKEFHNLLENSFEDIIQVDVRENNENGHGEIFSMEKVKLTRGYLEFNIEQFIPNKNKKVVIVCCSGRRSALAALTLKNLGYKNVGYLKGGVKAWLKDGYPLDTVYGELYLKKDY
nr:rhodanese-like domain-containing protein [uncultured Sulfurimonas sp.]